VDWSQNDDHKTTVCVYSLRAKERPTASTPVKWDEVEECLEKGDPKLLVFEAGEVLERAKKYGDLFAPVLKLKQKMPPLEALQGMETGNAATVASPAKPRQREEAPSRTASAKAKRTGPKKASTPRKRG
jgi:bifunctional non-homologous end joining protein LigD